MPDTPLLSVLPEWNNAYRIINSAFPPISVFEDTLDPADLDIAFALESLTNDRLRDQAGVLNRVHPQDRLCGEGSTPIIAALPISVVPAASPMAVTGFITAPTALTPPSPRPAFISNNSGAPLKRRASKSPCAPTSTPCLSQ